MTQMMVKIAPEYAGYMDHRGCVVVQLDKALYSGEQFICGDESMVPACALYGELLAWSNEAVSVSAAL